MSDHRQKQTLPSPLKQALGFIDAISFDPENNKARLAFDGRKEFLHSGGVIHGGFVTGWIDSAMAYVIHMTSDYQLTPLSLELKVSFLNPTLPGKVFAEAWIIKQGRSIAFLEGRLLNESGDVLATANSTVKLFPFK